MRICSVYIFLIMLGRDIRLSGISRADIVYAKAAEPVRKAKQRLYGISTI